MISADVKANIKQWEIKDPVAVSYKFLLEVPSSPWKTMQKVRKNLIWFWVVSHPSWYCLLTTGSGRGFAKRTKSVKGAAKLWRKIIGKHFKLLFI